MIMMEETRRLPRWRHLLPLYFGLIVLLSTIVFCILDGGRWFEAQDPNTTDKKEFANSLNKIFGPFYMLGYFTVQTNLFLGIMMIVVSCMPKSSRANSFLLGSVSLITITFIVYWALLARSVQMYEWLNPNFLASTLFLHAINPLFGFILIITLRKYIILNKRIVGVCSMYLPFFVAYHAILYGVGSEIINENGTHTINGATIYSFLDLQRILYLDLKDMPALAIFINVVVLLISPFLLVFINYLWAATLRLSYVDNSYFGWMERIKEKRVIKRNE